MSSLAAILPESVARQLELYRMGRALKQHGSRKLVGIPAEIEKSMDRGEMARLWQEVRDEYQRNPTSAGKYAMPRHWLTLNAWRAGQLELHRSSGLQILDIGCGPAFFLAVCRALGHHAIGVDAPESYMTPVERRIYASLIGILGLERSVSSLLIEKFVPLPYPEAKFDLITAYWICFNLHRQPGEWGVEEWRFFVEDAVRRLCPTGRLLLELNENPERYGALRFYDKPTLEYFRSKGTVTGGRVLVTRGQ